MIFRFSLYSFLKNQRYFEPFLILAFMEKGLSFFQIGILIAFREFAVNLLEIPSGAIADVSGRRLSMIISFAAYIGSFTVFGSAGNMTWFLPAMFLFSVGEAFRSGTHKAMIFTWLREQGRTDEKTRIYGFTRSWGKIGSALSVLIGAGFVFAFHNLEAIFYFSILPYLVNVLNLASYPGSLDGSRKKEWALGSITTHMGQTLKTALKERPLRLLILESMGYEGLFHTVKDYLQPVLKAIALTSIVGWISVAEWSEPQRVAITVGPIYFLLYLVSAWSSRQAHQLANKLGGERGAAKSIWRLTAAIFALLLLATLVDGTAVLVLAFVLLHGLQNIWRPTMISRFDNHADEHIGATIMSIESQARRLTTVVLAPIIGGAVDLAGTAGEASQAYWPIGLIGLAIAIPYAFINRQS